MVCIKYVWILSLGLFFLSFSGAAHAQYEAGLRHQAVIDLFYLHREGKPFWVKGSRLKREGKALLSTLKNAHYSGLNPQKYHIKRIGILLDEANNDKKRTFLEILLTDAYIEYVRDLSGMRIAAREIGLNPKHWRQRISADNALALLMENDDEIKFFLGKQEPQTATYQNLKSELKYLLENSDRQAKLEIISLDETLYPERGATDVPKLRTRFELPELPVESRYRYDGDLVEAVKIFQIEKGLKSDGIIGQQTLAALNRSEADNINSIILNMERLRWVHDAKPERFIVVNIPAATLWAVENGRVAYEMPVVVGRKKRQTIPFISEIHGVRFNPTWTVPETIKKEDILPNLIENPNYLADKGMELFDGYDRDAPTLDPSIIDWASLDKLGLAALRMVQTAGTHNPLGRIRVLMPNEHNIYLHDTNHKELFARSDRAKSSGCVRMERPEEIADFILKNKSNWDVSTIDPILDKPGTTNIYTQENMPVYLLYYTTWIGAQGQVVYGNDLYDRDNKLAQALEKLDEYPKMIDTVESNITTTQFVD